MSNKPTYTFSSNINKKLKPFKQSLQTKGNSIETIRQKSNYAGYYLNWLKEERLNIKEARYNDLISFIDYCRKQEKSNQQISRILASIRDYYNHLKKTDPNIKNPALNLYIRGIKQKLPPAAINYELLEKIYQSV